jgi:hypothetical protein
MRTEAVLGCGYGSESGRRASSEYAINGRMKTTLNIDDTVMTELKGETAQQGRAMSELVESALRLLRRSHRRRQ